MAVIRGCSGKVKIGGTAVGNLTDWEFSEQATDIDVSTMGSCSKSYTAGAVETEGTISCFWDPADAIQTTSMDIDGTNVALTIFPDGDASGKKYFSFSSVTFKGAEWAANGVDGSVTFNASFKANAQKTIGTVT